MAKRWKKEDETYLKRYAKTKHVGELAERFKTDPATVQLKLKDLGLDALDSVEPAPLEGSRQLEMYERALKALHGGKFDQALAGFEKVIEAGDQPDLINRAKRYASIAESRLEKRSGEADEPYLEAIYLKNTGDLEGAMRVASAGGRRGKDPRFAYLAASIHVMQEEFDEAGEFLQVAIELDPKTRYRAAHDADFEPLRASPEHAELFES